MKYTLYKLMIYYWFVFFLIAPVYCYACFFSPVKLMETHSYRMVMKFDEKLHA